MDLSTGGNLRAIRRAIVRHSPVPVGSVSIYDAAVTAVAESGKNILAMTCESMLAAFRAHASDGIDFITVHAGVTREVLADLAGHPRVCGMVSRGGTFLAEWMKHHKAENPYYERFDELLEIAREFDVTLSLGDGLRPGALADANDAAQLHELRVLAGLAGRARKAGVQVMIEGPGHVPLHLIAEHVRYQKELCDGAPFYVLGPLVTDVAPGYDHITSAIGGALAAAAGADFLCYVTPSEHLSLPGVEDVHVGVIAARIAAHAGDIAKGIPHAADWDRTFSDRRRKRDWEKLLTECIDPATAKRIREKGKPADSDVCSMCGEFCVFRLQDKLG
jgi:phosphomethylpyrimidine synthase